MTLIPVSDVELRERIRLNYHRLTTGDYYAEEHIFSPEGYDWYGDKEGRALLAFASHYKISGAVAPCMEYLLSHLEEHLNEQGYFGPIFGREIHEQQLSGHSWFLRGLCEHYELFGDELCLRVLRDVTEHLYLPLRGRFAAYPIRRDGAGEGGVSGSQIGEREGWILSSDVACAFMSVDGLSHVYRVTRDERVRELLDEMTDTYVAIDKIALGAQTHCTLTAARGMVRMYRETEDKRYLDGAVRIFDLYANGGGMTATYQNLNWWGRPDSWTEPCCIVDSMMLAGELYRLTGDEGYRTLAARIFHNGLASAQRPNGGAGTDSVVADVDGAEDTLRLQMYEAYFCCTMRLAEGLWYANANRDILAARVTGEVTRQGRVYADGDILYAEPSDGAEAYAETWAEVDGHRLAPLVKYYKMTDEAAHTARQRVLFD